MNKKKECNLPLERLLELVCSTSSASSDFPKQENYYDRYCEIVADLEREVYKDINAALAGLSNVSGLYTDHSADHFDEVVKYGGFLLGLKNSRTDVEKVLDSVLDHDWILKPYEIYIVLLSIRLHDVGNIYGRDNHEKRINEVIQRFKIVHLHKDKIESSMIASIAGAHGGVTESGEKDTIGNLSETGSANGHIYDIDNRKLAAITRFADEVCENRQRVGSYGAKNVPGHNLVFHTYAGAIVENYIKDRSLYLNLQFCIGHLTKLYQIYEEKKGKATLIDVDLPSITLARLRKAELERRYCNRFVPEKAQISSIFISITITEDNLDEESFRHEVIERITFSLKEEGYPLKNQVEFDNKISEFMDYKRLCLCKPEGAI